MISGRICIEVTHTTEDNVPDTEFYYAVFYSADSAKEQGFILRDNLEYPQVALIINGIATIAHVDSIVQMAVNICRLVTQEQYAAG